MRTLHRKPVNSKRANYPCFCSYLPKGLRLDGYDTLECDSFVSFAFIGDCDYNWETESVTLHRGRGCMIICTHSDPNALAKKMVCEIRKNEAALEEWKPSARAKPSGGSEEAVHLLSCLTTNEGLILSDPYLGTIDPMTQFLCVRALMAIGENRRARRILRAYFKSFLRDNRVSWSQSGGCMSIPAPCEDSVTPALIILAARYLPETKFIEDITPMLCTLMKHQRNQLVRAMMPFNGNERESAAKYLTYHGSSFATILFIESAKALCEMPGEREVELVEKLKTDVEECQRHFVSNFIVEGTPLLNSPARETAHRRPRFKFGYCEHCSPRAAAPEPTWLERTHYGVYLCSECSLGGVPERHAIDPNLQKISYNSVLWAALIGSALYPRGLVRQIAMSLISCPENEVNCRADAAILKFIARKFELDEKYILAAEELESRFDEEISASAIALDVLYHIEPKKRKRRTQK